jgi:hypothetical protein
MANTKTATLSFRVDPNLKDALCRAASNEHRSIANMVEVMIRDYCERQDVAIESNRHAKQVGKESGADQA